MSILGNKELKKELENIKLTKRLEKGRLEKEISELKSKSELLESQKADLDQALSYYKGLENDREKIEKDKKKLRLDKQDAEDMAEELNRKEARLKKRLDRLEAEENDEYKKGYSDGLADGLRKAHDITREDRKYLTMIAMSTNQSEAIKTSQKAISDGFERNTES